MRDRKAWYRLWKHLKPQVDYSIRTEKMRSFREFVASETQDLQGTHRFSKWAGSWLKPKPPPHMPLFKKANGEECQDSAESAR